MRRRFFTRESFIPKNAVKVSDKLSDAVAYLHEIAGKFYAVVFVGKQTKPLGNYYFRTPQAREAYVGKTFVDRRTKLAFKAARKPEAVTGPVQRFKVGQTYSVRSLGDYDCVYNFRIVARTEKTVTFEQYGEEKRRGLSISDNRECFYPHGHHSMCAVVYADDPEIRAEAERARKEAEEQERLRLIAKREEENAAALALLLIDEAFPRQEADIIDLAQRRKLH